MSMSLAELQRVKTLEQKIEALERRIAELEIKRTSTLTLQPKDRPQSMPSNPRR